MSHYLWPLVFRVRDGSNHKTSERRGVFALDCFTSFAMTAGKTGMKARCRRRRTTSLRDA